MGSLPSGISGSRASAILGLNKYQSQFHVWQNIIEEVYPGFNANAGYTMPDNPDNAPIRWGNAFEDAVIELAEQADGGLIGEREKLYSYAGTVPITCHIDGRYEDGKLHEGKTTNIFTFWDEWGDPGTDKIPSDYQIQCQHQMLCSGADEVILSVLVFPKRTDDFEKEGWTIKLAVNGYFYIVKNEEECYPIDWATQLKDMGFFHQYQIKANKKIQDKLLEIYSKWWQDHILGKKAPLDDISYDDMLRLCPKPFGTVVVDNEGSEPFKKYKKAGILEKKMKDKKIALKVEILKNIRTKRSIVDDDSIDKWLFFDENGDKLGSFNGKTFRT